MDRTDERSSLYDTVERVRAKEFPEIDRDLLALIVRQHLEMHDDPARVRRETERAVRKWLAGSGGVGR